jgi:hypothetical protein
VISQLLASAALPLGKEPPVHIGYEVGCPRTGLEDVERRKILPYRDSNSDPSAVLSVARRYTYCATPAPVKEKMHGKIKYRYVTEIF